MWFECKKSTKRNEKKIPSFADSIGHSCRQSWDSDPAKIPRFADSLSLPTASHSCWQRHRRQESAAVAKEFTDRNQGLSGKPSPTATIVLSAKRTAAELTVLFLRRQNTWLSANQRRQRPCSCREIGLY
jgi:hypothetical protein